MTTDLAVPSTTGLAAIPVTGSLTNSTDGTDSAVGRKGDSEQWQGSKDDG